MKISFRCNDCPSDNDVLFGSLQEMINHFSSEHGITLEDVEVQDFSFRLPNESQEHGTYGRAIER